MGRVGSIGLADRCDLGPQTPVCEGAVPTPIHSASTPKRTSGSGLQSGMAFNGSGLGGGLAPALEAGGIGLVPEDYLQQLLVAVELVRVL